LSQAFLSDPAQRAREEGLGTRLTDGYIMGICTRDAAALEVMVKVDQ
jgi:hypothetical protein